jgi:predicted SprT family Zn-dependent metalloprotease
MGFVRFEVRTKVSLDGAAAFPDKLLIHRTKAYRNHSSHFLEVTNIEICHYIFYVDTTDFPRPKGARP